MIKLTVQEIFRLGFAYGSFSVGEIDQGIHIILPVVDEDDVWENDVFTSLFSDYIDKIPKHHIDVVGQVYMGAIAAFAIDNQLDLLPEGVPFVEAYKRVVN